MTGRVSPRRKPATTTAGPQPHSPPGALLALTFVTGILDAVTFLGVAGVFAAMQTGNVIFLGFGLAGAADAPLLAPLVALAAFVTGGALAAALLAGRRGFSAGPAIAVEVALIGGAACLAAATGDVSAGEPAAYALVAALSLAMGLRNTLVRREGGQNLATTVLNLTLTAVTPQAGAAVASSGDLAQRGAAVAAILAGAATGALLLKASLALPLFAAAAVTAAAGMAGTRLRPVRA